MSEPSGAVRWVGAAVAAAVAIAIGLAGCGIPDETEVQAVEAGPSPGFATDSGAGEEPPTREAAATKDEFVRNYLKAAAGEPAKAYERVRQYLADGSRDKLKEKTGADVQLNIVRLRDTILTDAAGGSSQVTLKVDQVGVLRTDGSVDPPALRDVSYSFTIGGAEGSGGWFVTDPPDALLLSTEALGTFYEIRTLYFWNVDLTALVPDARYMLKAMPGERQPTEVVDWLIAGPSDWLRSAVRLLPPGTQRTENVPDPGDRLEVGLSAEAAAQSEGDAAVQVDGIDLLGRQLMWSLRPYLRTELQLKIEGQPPRVFTANESYLDANPAHRLSETPERFAVFEGGIRRHSAPNSGANSLPKPLSDDVNHGIVAAGLARAGDLTAAALVVRQGQRHLLRVGSATGDTEGSFAAGTQTYAVMGRPVWLHAPLDAGLVAADGALYQFRRDSAQLSRVALPEITGRVTAVSAAPDGRRIAVVADGKLYVTALTRDDGAVEAQRGRVVVTSLRQITAVDWSKETEFLVAGTNPDGRVAIWQVSPDGALDDQVAETSAVTYLVAYPENPLVSGSGPTKFMYVADGVAYDFVGVNSVLESGEVVGAPADATAGSVTAPFFLN